MDTPNDTLMQTLKIIGLEDAQKIILDQIASKGLDFNESYQIYKILLAREERLENENKENKAKEKRGDVLPNPYERAETAGSY